MIHPFKGNEMIGFLLSTKGWLSFMINILPHLVPGSHYPLKVSRGWEQCLRTLEVG